MRLGAAIFGSLTIALTASAHAAKPAVVVVEIQRAIRVEASADGRHAGRTDLSGKNGAGCSILNSSRTPFMLEAGRKILMKRAGSEGEIAWTQGETGALSIECGGGSMINTNGLEYGPNASRPEFFPFNMTAIQKEMSGVLSIRAVR